MTANCLVLSGVVSREPKHSVSPAGVPHCHFALDHESEQEEAGHLRRAWCRLEVVASGFELQTQTASLTTAMQLRVSGFICYRKTANGLGTVVLHAKSIEQIK
ncbi:primosomal replication protein N [Echinimonas agarilytica]|uniref:Replication restart protein PriB n=1 Tax=Echinimonas agarilytica TaxID=1215918 RepID=A0AA41W4H0_9GAMM|nr:primosomal replication protein N [Echinimonas agarilytica]MCM2678479.1 primosomal replication protein N [Echinimonas agarilytica]